MNALRLLTLAGRHGPVMLLAGMMLGILAPPLTGYAKPFMGLAVFLFTLGAFLKVDLAGFRQELARPVAVAAALAWTTFGVPLATFAATCAVPIDGELRTGLLLAMLTPPVGSAAAIAAMLGLSAPLALLSTVAATLAAPLYLPPLAAALTGAQLDLHPGLLALRLMVIVGGACAAATLLRRHARKFVYGNPHAMTGIAVLGLVLVAVGAMHGMQDMLRADTVQVAFYLLVALLANIGLQVLGTLLFASASRTRALTIGLVSGNRNVTLIWAAIAPGLAAHPKVELYLAMSVIPIFLLPAPSRWLIGRFSAGKPFEHARGNAGPTPTAFAQPPLRPTAATGSTTSPG